MAAWSLRAPFFLYAVTLVGAGALGLRALRHSDLAGRVTPREAMPLADAVRQPAYRAALVSTFAAQWAVIGVRVTLVPLFVHDVLHLGTGWTYAAFFVVSVASAVLLLPLGRLADTRGRRPVLVLGLVSGVGALAALPLGGDVAVLMAAMVVLGVAGAALSVAPAAVLGDVVGGRGGTVVAVFQMAGDTGSVAGPVVAGWLADAHGYTASFEVAAVVAALPVALVLRTPETRR